MSDLSASLWRALSQPRRLFLIAGPCVIESPELCLRIADKLRRACSRLGINYVFKASYDKANRTSASSFRGPGLVSGLKTLARVKDEVGVPVLTDVHTEAECVAAARVVDILQIPAFLCRQTDLIEAAVSTGAFGSSRMRDHLGVPLRDNPRSWPRLHATRVFACRSGAEARLRVRAGETGDVQ